MLVALYEHKVFCAISYFGISVAFDQWGVEKGKQIANQATSNFDWYEKDYV